MRSLWTVPAAALVVLAAALPARADVPNDPCMGKMAGDPCTTMMGMPGTCGPSGMGGLTCKENPSASSSSSGGTGGSSSASSSASGSASSSASGSASSSASSAGGGGGAGGGSSSGGESGGCSCTTGVGAAEGLGGLSLLLALPLVARRRRRR